MVSLWWGQNALFEQIENATSELLPANQEDIALHFTISDQIRSKKVNARDAMRALKRRMEHKNPNVQITTLSLTDTCVKNAGDQFVREIASREFMETLSNILHAPDCNVDVKNKILSVVQTWALAAKNNPNLSYLTDTYHLLQYEHFQFPPVKEHVNALLLETAAPPEWTDSDVCERCRTPFTFTNRKHHCRNCGGTFCQECSSKSMTLPHLAIEETVRICYGCYIKLKTARVSKKDGTHLHQQKQGTAHTEPTPSLARATAPQPLIHHPAVDEEKQFEEDLKKAIELSKKQAEQSTRPALSASMEDTKPTLALQSKKSAPANEGGDDPDLAAAIAASLRDMEDAQKTELEYYSVHRPAVKPITDELTAVEMENIELFATLMVRINAAGDKMAYDEQINRLYTQIGTLQPKLVNNLNEASQKHKKFADLHEKLINAVRTYDRLLEERVANSYQRVPSTGPYYGAPISLPYQNTMMNGTYAPPSAAAAPVPQLPFYTEQHTAVASPQYQNMQQPSSAGINNPAPYPYPPPSSYTVPEPATGALPAPAVRYNNTEQQEQQPIAPQPLFGKQTAHNYYGSSMKQWHPPQQQQNEAIYPSVPGHDPQRESVHPTVVEDTPLIDL